MSPNNSQARSPSVPVPPGGILPPGLVMRRRPVAVVQRSIQDGGFLPKIATTSCRRYGRFAPDGRVKIARSSSVGGIPPQEAAGILPTEDASEHQRALWFRRLARANEW